MAKEIIQLAKVYIGAFEITSDTNSLSLDLSTIVQDGTVLGNTTVAGCPGLKEVGFAQNGWFQHDGTSAINDILSSQTGVQDVIVTVAPTASGAENEFGFTFQSVQSNLTRLAGTVGDLAPIAVDVSGSAGDVVGGHILQATTAAVTANGDSTGFQEGAISATEIGYASIHVIAKTGTNPTMDVIVQSDDNSGFTSATQRVDFGTITDTTSAFSSVAGAITDDWWRVNIAAFGGTDTPSFTFIVVFGIV